MLFAISLTMLFAGGSRVKHLSLTVVCLVPVLMLYMLSAPYRMQRIMAYVHGERAGVNKAVYQSAQGVIAFGNGGLFGVGPGESRQRDFFLPESYGDFVYSIVGEEYGLIGTLFVMTAFLVILLRGMKIAKHAPDDFGRQLALGITASITLYALVNACVTLGVLPTTGLPMPFVSYGGTSMVFTAAAIGVLLNISSQTNLHPRTTAGAASGTRTQPVVASGRIS
jgi:cell division protein FtsW